MLAHNISGSQPLSGVVYHTEEVCESIDNYFVL